MAIIEFKIGQVADLPAANIQVTPSGDITNTDLDDVLNEIDSKKLSKSNVKTVGGQTIEGSGDIPVGGTSLEDNNIDIPATTTRTIDIPTDSFFNILANGTARMRFFGDGTIDFPMGGPEVQSETYGISWNNNDTVSNKGDIYNKLESLAASDITFSAIGNTIATDVQEAIVEIQTEVDGLSVSGISAENQRKIDNARKFKKVNHSSDFTFTSESILLTVNPDENKKPRHIVSGTDNVVFTVPDIGTLGEDNILIQNSGTGTVRVVPDTGEIFIGNDTNRTFGNTFTELTIPQFGKVELYKEAANTWLVDGNFTIVEPVPVTPTALYDGQNAADPENEVDGIANTEATANTSWASTSNGVTNGARALQFTLNTNGALEVGHILTQNIEIGDQIQLRMDVTKQSGTNATIGLFSFEGWDVSDTALVATETGLTRTAIATVQNPKISIQYGGGANQGSSHTIDNITLTKLN